MRLRGMVIRAHQEEDMKQALYRGPSASSLTGSGSSTDTLTAAASGLNSSSAPDLLSKGRISRRVGPIAKSRLCSCLHI